MVVTFSRISLKNFRAVYAASIFAACGLSPPPVAAQATAPSARTNAASSASAASPASAPTAAATVTVPQIDGKTLDGKPFSLGTLKGKVVLVMYWSTGCAVCRDKMPELRSNYEGWIGKPFELVAINTDSRVQDFLGYERILASTVPIKQRFVQLWAGESAYKDNLGKHAQLPAAYLVDKSGKIVERYVGRIPADAWDRISDLL